MKIIIHIFLLLATVNVAYAQIAINFAPPFSAGGSNREAFADIVTDELSDFNFTYMPNIFSQRVSDASSIENLIIGCSGTSLARASKEFRYLSELFIFKNANEWRSSVAKIPPIIVNGNVITAGIYGNSTHLLSVSMFPNENKNNFNIRVSLNISGHSEVEQTIDELIGYNGIKTVSYTHLTLPTICSV